MRKITFICCFLLCSLLVSHKAFAQDAKPQESAKAAEPPAHYYHLDYLVQELGADGKATNSRKYTTTVCTGLNETASIRAGSRIPVATGPSSEIKSSIVNTQFQYIDVGVNIDTRRVHEIDGQLSLDLTANISGMAASNNQDLHQPVIRENRWQAQVLIPIGKPTVVFTSDSLDSKGSMQVVVTATPLQ
ncbi:MAG: hypothetical protein WB608_22915 [Terracidiphilus sp.]